MRKISFTVTAAILILIGFGVWVGAWTTAAALAANTEIDAPGLTSGKNTPTSHYEDSLVFPAVIGQ